MLSNTTTLRCWTRGVGFPCDHYNPSRSITIRCMNSAPGLDSTTNPVVRLTKSLSLPPPPRCGGGGDELVGCSHGWVAMFNKRSNDLFLSNPLSHRIINLPPFDTLPDPDFNLDLDGHGSVSKLILSSSPDDDDDGDCRAMMTFGPANRLAFCLPGRSSDWTPIGDHFFEFDLKTPYTSIAKVHEDLVHCSRRGVFSSITAAHLKLRPFLIFDHYWNKLERCDWDIQNPNFPKLVRFYGLYFREYRSWWWWKADDELVGGKHRVAGKRMHSDTAHCVRGGV